jgi:hypothetical protein
MLPKPTAANFIICQRVLQEKDDVLSLIRAVDVFYVLDHEKEPSERSPVSLALAILLKFPPDDRSKHEVRISITRPDGTTKPVGDPIEADVSGDLPVPGAPRGYNATGALAVAATHLGTHVFTLLVDGVEVATAPFTLTRVPPVGRESE